MVGNLGKRSAANHLLRGFGVSLDEVVTLWGGMKNVLVVSNIFIFYPYPGEMIQSSIFQMG